MENMQRKAGNLTREECVQEIIPCEEGSNYRRNKTNLM